MAELIRKRWFQVIGIAFLLIVFVVAYRFFGKPNSNPPSNIVADICGVRISRLEYQTAIRRRTMRIYMRDRMLRGSDQENIHISVFRQLANDKLLEKIAKEKNITVTEKDIDNKIETIKKNFEQDRVDYAYQLFMEMMGYASEEELRRDLRAEVLEEKLTERMYPLDSPHYEPDDKELHKHIPTIELQQIYLVFDPNRPLSEDIEHSSEKIKERAQMIYQRAMAGEDFGELAVEFSQERHVAMRGKLGWIARANVTKSFWDNVSKLNVDEISKPFETEYGLHIVKCLGRREKDSVDYQNYKKAMVNVIKLKRQKREFVAWFTQQVTAMQEKDCIKLYDHVLLANKYRMMGKFDKAIKEYKEAIKEDPENPYYYVDIGELLGRQGDKTKALKWLRDATQRAPRDPSLFFRLGEVYMGYGENEKGLREFQKASDMAKLDHEIHLRLQSIYTQLGLLREADEEHLRYLHALELRGGADMEQASPETGIMDDEDALPMPDFGIGAPDLNPPLRQPETP